MGHTSNINHPGPILSHPSGTPPQKSAILNQDPDSKSKTIQKLSDKVFPHIPLCTEIRANSVITPHPGGPVVTHFNCLRLRFSFVGIEHGQTFHLTLKVDHVSWGGLSYWHPTFK